MSTLDVQEWSLDGIRAIDRPGKGNVGHVAWPQTEPGSTAGGHYGSFRWYGVEGGAKAVRELERKGWPEGLQKAREAIGAIEAPKVRSYRRERRRADFGDTLDIQRVYRGDLARAWETRVRRVTAGHSLVSRIYVGVHGAHTLSADDLFWPGAAACVLADTLEASGRSTEIIVFNAVRKVFREQDDKLVSLVNVKPAGTLIDLESLATITALSGWFRTHLFRATLTRDKLVNPHMGATIDLPDGIAGPNDIVIQRCHSQHEAIKQVRAAVARLDAVNVGA